jgi:hypothetical protein
VHERLLYLKQQTKARSINDVIDALICIGEEQYLNGTITTSNKQIMLRYDKGKLVEIQVKRD